MADIFLSYASKDRSEAIRILEKPERTVFWDRSLKPGMKWEETLFEELRWCRCLVVLWSPHGLRSQWVSREADEGRKRKILVPIIISGTVELSIPAAFRDIQSIDLTSEENSIKELEIDSLVSHIDRQFALPPPPPPIHSAEDVF